MQSNRLSVLTLLGIFIFSISALAMNGRTTYQAKIVKPDGYPLEASNVNFRFTVLDSVGSCVLYVEDYSAVNMSGGGGLISFALGNGNRSFPVSGTSLTFQNTFDNSVPMFNCQTPGTYNPGPNDTRKIVMQFNDGNGWQTLPAMAINAVPYAMYANKSNDSKTLNGKSDTAFVENSTLAALNCNPATHAITFNGVSFSCIPVGSSSSGITSVTTSGTVLVTGGTASAPVISIKAVTMSQDGYLTSLDYAEFKAKLAASSTQIINTLGYAPVSSSAVATQITNSNLSGDVSGTVSANSVVSVGGKTASQISTSVNDTLAATSSATADTIVKRNSSGNATFNDVYANAAKINYVDIYKPSTSFNIRLQAPTSLSTNYVLNFPTTSGTTGQVLSTDGAGNLSWINPSTGSVVSVSATAPLASTGGSNPTISITQATSSTAGYLSSTDWNTFNNKQAATSAAIIATLGYTPADNAASGTYAQKASNLSDLASIATARTNLGLGTLATANSIDLGSASATGIIADARLQAQANVTSGTQYTKVTVDGKGRVTSGAQLSSSDVTTALGYTPANSTSGVTSLNGSASQTQTFTISNTGTAFGISTSNGIHTFAIPLAASSSVTAGLLSNADYTTFTNKQNATSAAIIATLGYTPANATSATQWTTNGSNIYYNTGNIGVGVINPSAKLELASGTASVAPLKFTSGTLLSSAQSGTMEYDGFNFYLTDSTNARRTIATGSSAGTIDNASNINSSGNITMTPVGSVIVSSTTASTNSNTGALVVKGGLGVAGNINTAGNLNVSGSQVIDGSLKLSSMTSGSVLFAGTGGTVTQDNSSLYWDGANKRLGIGGNSPAQTLSVSGSGYFSGNVGIGTSSPINALSISGTANITGGLLVGDGTQNSAVARLDAANYAWYGWYLGGVRTAFIQSTASEYSIYSQKSGVPMTLYTSSTERVRIDSNGYVGIGTTSPAAALHVNSSSGAPSLYLQNTSTSLPYLQFQQGGFIQSMDADGSLRMRSPAGSGFLVFDTNGANERMRIDSTGNVGIGTSSPNATLAVSGNVKVGAPADTIAALSIKNSGSGGIRIFGDASGITNTHYYMANTANDKAAAMAVDSTDGRVYFMTYNGLWNERMAIASGGNVGIGTNAPTAKLDILGVADNSNVLKVGNFTVDAFGRMYNGLLAGSYSTLDAGIAVTARSGSAVPAAIFQGNSTTGDLTQWRNSSGTVLNVVKSDGNVGIGITTPTAKLHLAAGTSSTAALKFTSGTLLTSPQSGTMEYDGTNFYLTDSTNTRRAIAANTNPGTYDNVSNINSSSNITLTPTGSVIVSSTTASTNSSTGALVVKGGMGVAGDLNVAGTISGSAKVMATGFRANQGVPDAADSSTNGYAFGADGDTGMFSPGSGAANGVLAFYGNNAELMRITASGAVGIGTTNPSALLQLSSSIQLSERLRFSGQEFYQAGNTDTEGLSLLLGVNRTGNRQLWIGDSAKLTQNTSNTILRLSPSAGDISALATDGITTKNLLLNSNGGNVGIGTGSPISQLHVASGPTMTSGYSRNLTLHAQHPALQFKGISDTNHSGGIGYDAQSISEAMRFWVGATSDDLSGTGTLAMSITASGNVGIGTASPIFPLSVSGTIQGRGVGYFTQSSPVNSLAIDATSSTLHSIYTNAPSVDLSLGTNNSTSQLYLKNNGNVGIGTLTPGYALSVYRGTAGVTTNNESGSAGSAAQNRYAGLTAGSVAQVYGTGLNISNGNGGYEIYDYTAGASRMFISTAGNVGIGIVTPGSKLDVKGDNVNNTFRTTDASGQYRARIDQFYDFYMTSVSGTDTMVIKNSGNVGIGTTNPSVKLQVAGPISHPNEVLGVASFYDGGTQAYFKVLTKIPWMGGNGSAAQIRVRGYGYGSPDFDTTISWYEWTNTFYSPGAVTKFHSAIGTRAPSRVRMGVWNDAGTNRVAVEIANDSVYWSSYSVDLYKHAGLSDSYASGWTTSAGAFDAAIINITDVPQVGPVVQSNAGNVGIGTSAPVAVLHSKNAALVGGNPATTGTADAAILQRIEANTGVLDIGMQSSGAVWLQPRDRTNLASNFNLLLNSNGGNVGIGTTAPGYTLHVVGTAGLSTGTAWTNASDRRLKDIQGDYEYGLNEVLKLHTVRYNYKKDNALGLPSDFSKTGFIAQEVQKVIPDAVNVRKDGYLELNVDPIHWAVVNAVKDLYKLVVEIKNEILGEVRGLASIVSLKADKAEIEDLRKDNVALKQKAAEVDELKAENEALKAYLCSKDPAAPICK